MVETQAAAILTFPSIEDQADLRRRLKDQGLASFTERDRWRWYAYALGFLRVYEGSPHLRSTPIDPEAKWFSAAYADQAERFYRNRMRPQRPKRPSLTPAEAERDPERKRLFEDQDDERARLAARIVGDGRLPNREPSPELVAYLDCCKAQARQNGETFARRQRSAIRSRHRPLADLSEGLAVMHREFGTDDRRSLA